MIINEDYFNELDITEDDITEDNLPSIESSEDFFNYCRSKYSQSITIKLSQYVTEYSLKKISIILKQYFDLFGVDYSDIIIGTQQTDVTGDMKIVDMKYYKVLGTKKSTPDDISWTCDFNYVLVYVNYPKMSKMKALRLFINLQNIIWDKKYDTRYLTICLYDRVILPADYFLKSDYGMETDYSNIKYKYIALLRHESWSDHKYIDINSDDFTIEFADDSYEIIKWFFGEQEADAMCNIIDDGF